MRCWDKNYQIIENTEEAIKEHGWLYGREDVFITKEDLKALEAGKLLAITVNSEYVAFVAVEQGVQ